MTRERKIKLFIAIICLILCLFEVKQTYAKYTESKEGQTEFAVAMWRILLNGTDISSNAQLSSLINPVYENNNNIKNGVIAPGSEGYFDLVINATNTEVSFSYNISITSSVQSAVSDLVVYAYKINDGAITQVTNGLNNLTNTINYNDPNKVINLRVYFKWLEGTGEQMNNTADTNAAINGGTGKLVVRAAFTQVVN